MAMSTSFISTSIKLESNSVNPVNHRPLDAKSYLTLNNQSHHAVRDRRMWINESMRLIQNGELLEALQCVNMCLNNSGSWNKRPPDRSSALTFIEELSLLERRCFIHMKLKMYEEITNDVQKILAKKPTHAVAFKCLIGAYCKLNKLEQVADTLKSWKMVSPNDLEMIECRTKVESLITAVQNGIEPAHAFSNIEESLGLKYSWLLDKRLIDTDWKYRPVPPGNEQFVLCLQYRFGHCSLGEKCTEAHSQDELEEWRKRRSLISVTKANLSTAKDFSGATYIQSLVEEFEALRLAKQVSGHTSSHIQGSFDRESELGISILVSHPLKIVIRPNEMSPFIWTFTIKSNKIPLSNVCLLYELHRSYFEIANAYLKRGEKSINFFEEKRDTTYGYGVNQLLEMNPASTVLDCSQTDEYCYCFDVKFQPQVFGTFRQAIVFDFKGNDESECNGFKQTKFLRDVIVDIVGEDEGRHNSAESNQNIMGNNGHLNNNIIKSESLKTQRPNTSRRNTPLNGRIREGLTWNFGNAEIVDSYDGSKVCSTKIGFALIHGHGKTYNNTELNDEEQLSKSNYKEKMRYFLTEEEKARQEILSKYNISASLVLMEKYETKSGLNEGMVRYAVDGRLFARMALFRDVSEDTAVGRLILRNCNSVLLSKSEDVQKAEQNGMKPKVYLSEITEKTKNAMYLDLGSVICSELNLVDGDASSFDIQFQLDRTSFMQQKMVVDLINEIHMDILFPDFEKDMTIPWNPVKQWNSIVETENFRLNPKQKEALIAVTSENITPPILIIGSFGTGKTFLLAQCIKTILSQSTTRILVCTHSNSAADLYVKDYLDSLATQTPAAKPLRIYFALRSLSTVHPTVLKYCVIENGRFKSPTKEQILSHRVIVVTLSTSFELIDLKLDPNTFSHILLDEAAQAMESEAITPLLAGGKNTKLVLAGDYMQLSQELFSSQSKHFHTSLLERLHCLYPEQNPCKIYLCENYRSHASIIQFASDSFYHKKLRCGKTQPAHSLYYPLTFFCARGEDVQEKDSTSYYNMAEVFEICEKVSEVVSSWPESWGDWREENSIGILTAYPDQVNRIRARLRTKGLGNISVERVLNVQGKQFRAIFISTVRTSKPWVHILPETVGNQVDLGFFSNPKLLNTALTRAQSLVAVVGDPVSLCSLGKCRLLWKDFIQICHENKSLFGISYSQIKQSILGIEMRLTWGLNPLANEFEPSQLPTKDRPNAVHSAVNQVELGFQDGMQKVTDNVYEEWAGVENPPQKKIDNPPHAVERAALMPEPSPGLSGAGTSYSQFSGGSFVGEPRSQRPAHNYQFLPGPPIPLPYMEPTLLVPQPGLLPMVHQGSNLRPRFFVYPAISQGSSTPMFRPTGVSAFAAFVPQRGYQQPPVQRMPLSQRVQPAFQHQLSPPNPARHPQQSPHWNLQSAGNVTPGNTEYSRNATTYPFISSQYSGIPLQHMPQQRSNYQFEQNPVPVRQPNFGIGTGGSEIFVPRTPLPSNAHGIPNYSNEMHSFSPEEIVYMKRALEYYYAGGTSLNTKPNFFGNIDLGRLENLHQKLAVAANPANYDSFTHTTPTSFHHINNQIPHAASYSNNRFTGQAPNLSAAWQGNQPQATPTTYQHGFQFPGNNYSNPNLILGEQSPTSTTGSGVSALRNNNAVNNSFPLIRPSNTSNAIKCVPVSTSVRSPSSLNQNVASSSASGRSYANVVKKAPESEARTLQMGGIEAIQHASSIVGNNRIFDSNTSTSSITSTTSTVPSLPTGNTTFTKPVATTSTSVVPLMSVPIPLSTIELQKFPSGSGANGRTKKSRRRKK